MFVNKKMFNMCKKDSYIGIYSQFQLAVEKITLYIIF